MAVLHLDAGLLHSAVIKACKNLIAQRANLNAINVFPVADGDTGDNMAATARAIVNYAHLVPNNLAETCKSLANAGIMGARGNSGMIFSQFFNGLLESLPSTNELSTQQFAHTISQAAASVRSAIANPVEGTILSVMDAWAASLAHHALTTDCYLQLLAITLQESQDALLATRDSLPILREAQVVDAGAQGFQFFLQGFADYLANPGTIENDTPIVHEEEHQHELPAFGDPPLMRYCTEAVLHGEGIDKDRLRQCLQQQGDSIVLTANQQLSRLHVHCNEPWQIFNALREIGHIQCPKVDDMRRQYEVLHARKFPIALVTDSSANIPQSLIDQHQIHMIALNVHFDEHDLLDKYSFDSRDFYDTVTTLKTYPRTSFPAPAIITDKINHLANHYEHVLVLSVAQALSGAHDALVKIAAQHQNVHIMNSRHVAGSQGLLVDYAAQMIMAAQPIETIKEALTKKISKTHMFVMVDQFESMIRSGRVSRLKGKFAQFSGIKPILSLDPDGRGIIVDKAFSETKALAKIVSLVHQLSEKNPLAKYCIIHAGVPEKAAEFAWLATEALGQPPAFIEPVSTAVGLHAGKGCVAIAAMME